MGRKRSNRKHNMKLVVIYGPPAVGKLTVAKELAQKTGFKLFHNHLAIDLVVSVFPFGTAHFSDLLEKIKLMVIEDVAKNNTNLIYTLAYGVETFEGKRENDFVNKLIKIVEGHGGKAYFVRLTCSKQEQIRRLGEKSRKAYQKITDPKVLREVEKAVKLDEQIPFVKSLIMNTTDLSPKDAADKIIHSL